MNLYLCHRDPSRSETRNSNGIHAALCVAADEAAALEVCELNAPTGETRIDGWLVELLAAGVSTIAGAAIDVLYIEGQPVGPPPFARRRGA